MGSWLQEVHPLQDASSDPVCALMESYLASRPQEVVCMDYTKLEEVCGKEDVVVITDVFTKFSLAVATLDQTAETTTTHKFRFSLVEDH